MTNPANLFTGISADLLNEQITTLISASGVRIERIVSRGHASEEGFWYDQDEHEWVILLQGAAKLRFADGGVDLRAGDFLHIPAHTKHRVEWTPPDELTIWLVVFFNDVK